MAACWAEREGEDGRDEEGVEDGEQTGVLDRREGFDGMCGVESVEILNDDGDDGVYLCLYEAFVRNFEGEIGVICLGGRVLGNEDGGEVGVINVRICAFDSLGVDGVVDCFVGVDMVVSCGCLMEGNCCF
jgi:hypothetical protein